MLQKLRRRLTLLCGCMTAAILVGVVLVLLVIAESRLENRGAEAFRRSVTELVTELKGGTLINDRRLAELESQGRNVIDLEADGQPIHFSGAWQPATPREALVERARELFSGAKLSETPLVGEISGDGGERYRCAAVQYRAGNSLQRVYYLRDGTAERRALWWQRGSFAAVAAAGTLLLFAASRWLAGRMVAPVEEGQRRQVAFVAAASHELRAPLAVIRANADAPISPTGAAAIRRECDRMARLVGDLLLLAEADTHAWTLGREWVAADTLLIEAFDAYQPLAQARGQELTLELPEEAVPPVCGDGERLAQILAILLDNAIAYTPERGHIRLACALLRNGLRIRVADDGPGIPEEDRERIFERFYRSEAARSNKRHLGLGLAIARELAQQHGGRLVLEEAERGATFALYLPEAPNAG